MKAKSWAQRFNELGEEAVPAFVQETVDLAAARKGSDMAVESAVRQQKQVLVAAGLDPADMDQWLAQLEPAFYERYRKTHYRLLGQRAVNKFGLAGRPGRAGKGRRKHLAVR